jgi:hypothetical protein
LELILSARPNWISFAVSCLLFYALLYGCSAPSFKPAPSESAPAPSDTPQQPTPSPQLIENTFEITFDGSNCHAAVPAEVPAGEYLFQLNNQSDRNVDVAVTHLIDDHTYQDLLDLQSEPGEPFVKVYWMSQPYYYTRDHKVWNYSLDEAGEYAILILQHVHVGMWICGPFRVIEAASE